MEKEQLILLELQKMTFQSPSFLYTELEYFKRNIESMSECYPETFPHIKENINDLDFKKYQDKLMDLGKKNQFNSKSNQPKHKRISMKTKMDMSDFDMEMSKITNEIKKLEIITPEEMKEEMEKNPNMESSLHLRMGGGEKKKKRGMENSPSPQMGM